MVSKAHHDKQPLDAEDRWKGASLTRCKCAELAWLAILLHPKSNLSSAAFKLRLFTGMMVSESFATVESMQARELPRFASGLPADF